MQTDRQKWVWHVPVPVCGQYRRCDGQETTGAVSGCLLTKVEATEVQLELRFQAADASRRDAQRATVMLQRDRQFTAAGQGAMLTPRPTFG
jgi:hypothetical protein